MSWFGVDSHPHWVSSRVGKIPYNPAAFAPQNVGEIRVLRFNQPTTQIVKNKAPSPAFRVGLGYDSHRLGPGGPLRVGGIDLSCEFHAIGHSDADVLLHALTDALLGAMAQPDIGQLFPDCADDNAGRASSDFVAEAVRRVRVAGYQIGNVDGVILAQKPKMAAHIDRMRAEISQMLACPVEVVGLKAKTGEGVDSIGLSEAIAARVIVMLIAVA